MRPRHSFELVFIFKESEPCAVTWRDRSDIFAVSYFDKKINSRRLSIFDREGTHLCSNELKADVSPGSLVAFRPCGDLIATNGRSANGSCIVNFFERNCLNHGSFVVDQNKNTAIYKVVFLFLFFFVFVYSGEFVYTRLVFCVFGCVVVFSFCFPRKIRYHK